MSQSRYAKKEEFYLGVYDTEQSGPDVTRNALINLGVVIKRVSDNVTVKRVDIIMNLPEGRTWNPSTEAWLMNQPHMVETVNTVKAGGGVDHISGMNQFVEFVRQQWEQYNGNIVFGSDRIGVDNTWINTWLSLAGYLPLHLLFKEGEVEHQIDISSFHQGCVKTTHSSAKEFRNATEKKYCPSVAALKHFNIGPSNLPFTHRAVDDAEAIASSHVRILQGNTSRVLTNLQAIDTLNTIANMDRNWTSNNKSASWYYSQQPKTFEFPHMYSL